MGGTYDFRVRPLSFLFLPVSSTWGVVGQGDLYLGLTICYSKPK